MGRGRKGIPLERGGPWFFHGQGPKGRAGTAARRRVAWGAYPAAKLRFCASAKVILKKRGESTFRHARAGVFSRLFGNPKFV